MPLTNLKSPNFIWPDGSGFQYDLPPQNVAFGFSVNPETGGNIYDVATVPIQNGTFVGWSQWFDKFQKDYRFAALSDQNARANLFPEVSDPWTYTEYFYEGTGKVNAKDDANDASPGIIEPPLLRPDYVNRTFGGGGMTCEPEFLTFRPATVMPTEFETIYKTEPKWKSDVSNIEYWESELAALGWLEQTGEYDNTKFTQLTVTRQVAQFAAPKVNSGVKLYHQPVWSKAIRWGQSQNIPERTLTHTAPKDWVRPEGQFTGRIIPVVKAITGTPIFDNSPNVGGQGCVVFDMPGSGFWDWDGQAIGLKSVQPMGANGPSDSEFSYTPTSDIAETSLVAMPVKPLDPYSSPALKWVDIGGPQNYSTGSLVHRGCAFWKGSGGTASCTMYSQNQTRFQPTYAAVKDYVDPTAPSTTFFVPAFSATEQEVVVLFGATSSGPWIDEAHADKIVELVFNNGLAVGFKVGQTGGSPDPDLVHVKIQVVRKDRPVTHASLCAHYDGSSNPRAAYFTAGGQCGHFTPQGAQTLATYEAEALNGAEWANLQRGLPPGYKQHPYETAKGQAIMDLADAAGPLGMGIGTAIAMVTAATIPTPDPFTKGIDPVEITRLEVSFVPEVVDVSGKSTYYDTDDGLPAYGSSNPDSDLKVTPGTGHYLLDEKAQEPIGGVDTTFFGSVNQINYRITNTVMHCYKAERCDSIINNPSGFKGWIRNRYSNINFTSHPLKAPAAVGHDGTDQECHYGDGRCPYTRLDRRAVEYHENYKVLISEILRPFAAYGVDAFESMGIIEAFIVDGRIKFLTEVELETLHPNAMCVGARLESGTAPVLGHWQPLVMDESDALWRVYFYYDHPSFSANHRLSNVAAHIVQFNDDDLPVYTQWPDDIAADMDVLFQDSTTVPWITVIDRDYITPEGNTTKVTNKMPFAGGVHPEYKDQSQRGEEIICETGATSNDHGAGGRTGTNQFGGPTWNRTPTRRLTRMGYRTDKDGEFIIDQVMIPDPGTVLPTYISIDDRISNIPPRVSGFVPISGVPGILLQDKEGPEINRTGDYAAIAAAYSGDTEAMIAWYNELTGVHPVSGDPVTRWWTLLEPRDELGLPIPNTLPPNIDTNFLPRERVMYRCNVCGICFSEETTNFFIDPPGAVGPLYPLSADPPDGALCGCPRGDGGDLIMETEADRILDTRAQGEAHLWSTPGTTVRYDAFFWKVPTPISRAHLDQIQFKLGPYHSEGGSYSFDGMSEDTEQMGTLPISYSHGYNPGVNHQLVAPWAAAGETVTIVRNRLTSDFGLEATDKALIISTGTTVPVVVTNESTVLTLGQIVMFQRDYGDFKAVVGMAVGVQEALAASILQDPAILGLDPRPLRNSFADGEHGDRLFNHAIRNWILSSVTGTNNTWASTSDMGMSSNLLAASLVLQGIDPSYGHQLDPVTGNILQVDERVIAPYQVSSGGGLKMITLPHLKKMRNQLLPTLAYEISSRDDTQYTAGGDFYNVAQASSNERFLRTSKPLVKLGTIAPQVLAATQTGKDYYVEWDTGDVLGTRARAYYPVGSTWWRLNQKIGCIRRSGGSNALHLDQSNPNEPGGEDYTGDHIESACVFFMHGHLPMDKEVAKAYLIYQTEDGPYAPAIGAQGQYDGFAGNRTLGGNVSWGDAYYVGHEFCFWQHYHPFLTEYEHEIDNGSFGREVSVPFGSGFANAGYNGVASKDHWDEFGINERTVYPFNQSPQVLGGPVVLQDAEELSLGELYRHWGPSPADSYYPHVGMLGLKYVDNTYGFIMDQDFLTQSGWAEPIQQNLTEHEIWKAMSVDNYQGLVTTYSVSGQASIDDVYGMQSMQYLSKPYRNFVRTQEHQGIPGWLDFSEYDTSGRISKQIDIEPQTYDSNWANGPQVIVQEDALYEVPPDGGQGFYQAGNVKRVLDITGRITQIYNDRVDRFFAAQLGWGESTILVNVLAKTFTNQNPTIPTRFDEIYPPLFSWNYRTADANVGLWLNDPWHHPPLLGDQVVEAGTVGDPLLHDLEDQKARIQSVSAWDTQGLDSGHADYMNFHPWQLCSASHLLDESSTPESPLPIPMATSTKYWRVIDSHRNTNGFVMDLRQTPYETMRKEWRYLGPRIDSSAAVCPNVNGCWVAKKGWTVGQLYQATSSQWGLNVIPSIASAHCSICQTKMTTDDGLVAFAGDGITTVQYDSYDDPDALVAHIDIAIASSDGWESSVKHGFVVEYFNSTTQMWRLLFQVDYDRDANLYRWIEWQDTAWVATSNATLPLGWFGALGAGSVPKFPSEANGATFIIPTACKVRFRVIDPAPVAKANPSSGYATAVSVTDRSVKVNDTDLTELPSKYVGRRLTVRDPGSGNVRTFIITSVDETTPATPILMLAGEFASSFTQWKIEWTNYITKCTVFNVYGFPFAAGEVTITPPAFVQPIMFSEGNNEFTLNAYPTQVQSVLGKVGDSYVPMDRITDRNDPAFLWTTASASYDGVTYERITRGRWFYDHKTNRIVIPAKTKMVGETEVRNLWGDLNAELYADGSNPFNIQTLPTQVLVEFFTGIGMPINVKVEAIGDGPSYQLDRECVSFIHGHGSGSHPNLPAGVLSESLPPMGQSEKLINNQNTAANLYWQVYNHEPLIWEPQMAWIVGDELGAGQWDTASIHSVFSGGRGSNYANLGPGAKMGGRVSGEVTLYGTPNTIISGDLAVYAKATTTRTYHLPDGSTTTSMERTGGYRSGAFVFRLTIPNEVSGRKALMASVPTVLIYLKERNLSDPI